MHLARRFKHEYAAHSKTLFNSSQRKPPANPTTHGKNIAREQAKGTSSNTRPVKAPGRRKRPVTPASTRSRWSPKRRRPVRPPHRDPIIIAIPIGKPEVASKTRGTSLATHTQHTVPLIAHRRLGLGNGLRKQRRPPSIPYASAELTS